MSSEHSESTGSMESADLAGQVSSPPASPPAVVAGAWGVAACVLLGLAVLIHVNAERTADPDLFVTLYSGAEIAAHGGPPGVDTVTFSVPGQPWMDHEWLSRLLFHVLHQRFGSAGLVVLRLVLLAAALGALYAIARRHGSGRGMYLLTLLLLSGTYRFFLFRPTLFTFAFFAISLALCDALRDGARWPLFAFPPLLLAWVNLHGGFAIGVTMVGLVLFEGLIERWQERGTGMRFDWFARPPRRTPIPALALSCAACCAATGLNPYGYRIWESVFRTLGSPMTRYITEWQPMFTFGFARHAVVYLLMVLTIGVLVSSRRKGLRPFDALLIAGLMLAAILRVRFVPLFGFAAGAVLLRLASRVGLPVWCRERMAGIAQKAHWLRAALLVALVALCAGVWTFEGIASGEIRTTEELSPVAGVKYLAINGIIGPMNVFNEYDWGGYIRYRLPQARIFIDGRADTTVYPSSLGGEWARFVRGRPEAYGVPDHYGAEVIVLRRSDPVVPRLEQDAAWVGAYGDATTAIFLRRCPANQQHLDRILSGNAEAPRMNAEDYLLDAPVRSMGS